MATSPHTVSAPERPPSERGSALREQQRNLRPGALPDESRQQPPEQLVHTRERESLYWEGGNRESVCGPAADVRDLRRVRPLGHARQATGGSGLARIVTAVRRRVAPRPPACGPATPHA